MKGHDEQKMVKNLFGENNFNSGIDFFNNKQLESNEKKIKKDDLYNTPKFNSLINRLNDNNENIINEKNVTEDTNSDLIIEKSTPLFDIITNIYGDNLSKNEFIFQEYNRMSSIIPINQHQNIKKKSSKNNESNIISSTNLSTNEKQTLKCTCKNSNCIKFYCECFANGRFCDNCSCQNCQNNQDNKELRQEKYDIIISRNPKAIQKINSTKRSWTCRCKNSNCSKKYCDCFQNKKFCTSKCRCINCFNKNIGSKNDNQKNNKRIRGIRTKKNKILLKKGKKHGGGEENSKIFEEKNEHVTNKYVTPRKSKTTCDNNDIYIFYERNASTNAFTGKRERKRLIEN